MNSAQILYSVLNDRGLNSTFVEDQQLSTFPSWVRLDSEVVQKGFNVGKPGFALARVGTAADRSKNFAYQTRLWVSGPGFT